MFQELKEAGCPSEELFEPSLERTYWHAEKNRFYFDDGSTYLPVNEKGLRILLKKFGLFKDIIADKKREYDAAETECFERFLAEVMIHRRIDWPGVIAGYKQGLQIVNGVRLLITEEKQYIQSEQGECPNIQYIMDELLPDEQADYWHARLKLFFEALDSGAGFCFNQAFILVGETQCGKSLLVEQIISPLLGGDANAIIYLNENNRFNADLARAAHWVIDDQGEKLNFSRRVITDGYKKCVSSPKIRVELKGGDVINVPTARMLTVLTNHGSKNINLIPEIEEDNADKISLFLASKVELKTKPNQETNVAIRRELAAYRYWLQYEYQIPESILSNDRFGIKTFTTLKWRE
jgi:hypothetical protein